MKKYFKVMVMLGILGPLNIYAQVGMPTNNPNPNAVLDLNRTDGTSEKGLLLPKVALKATDNFAPMAANVAGMKVYNTATDGSGATAVTPGEYNNDGTKWVRVASKDETSNAWNLGGNTNGAIKELGTKDAQPIPFITNGIEKMNLSTTGALALSSSLSPSFDLPLADYVPNVLQEGLGSLRLLSNSTNYQSAGLTSTVFHSGSSATWGGGFQMIRGRGTHASPTALQADDNLGFIVWKSYNPSISGLKLMEQASIRVNVFSNNSGISGTNPNGLTGRMTLSTSPFGTTLTLGKGIMLGNPSNLGTSYLDIETGATMAGTFGSNFYTYTSTSVLLETVGFDASIHIATANAATTFTLPKANTSNKGRIYIVSSAGGGGTSSTVILSPISGDKIGLYGNAMRTTNTPPGFYYKVISNGVDTWYQIP